MNKLFLFLLSFVTFNVFSSEVFTAKIIPYDIAHKDAVLAIAFEDVLKFFCGSDVVTKGLLTEEQFIEANKNEMDKILSNPKSIIQVLIADDKVVGFVEFIKSREHSIEGMIKMMAEQGLPACSEEVLVAANPNMKKKDAECINYALIECLAVSKDFRSKGFGKALLKNALATIKQLWPSLEQVRLTVNESNSVARKLYESLRFESNPDQLKHLILMKIVEYHKSLDI